MRLWSPSRGHPHPLLRRQSVGTQAVISTLQHAYPESVTAFYVINAPSMFTVLWKLVRPMLDEQTAEMVAMLRWNPTSPGPYSTLMVT